MKNPAGLQIVQQAQRFYQLSQKERIHRKRANTLWMKYMKSTSAATSTTLLRQRQKTMDVVHATVQQISDLLSSNVSTNEHTITTVPQAVSLAG